MSIAIIMPDRDVGPLCDTLRQELGAVPIEIWPEIRDPAAVRFAVLWQPPDDALNDLPGLRAVTSYGAGVDGLVEVVPPDIPLGRIVDPGLVQQMSAYLLSVVLGRERRLEAYRSAQQQARWAPELHPVSAHVGLLGLGQLGLHVADCFVRLGWPVSAWCQTERVVEGVEVVSGPQGLAQMAAAVDYLICLLPLTPATRGLLNADLFEQMQSSAYLINVGRGAHLVEPDLIDALDRERLAGACLDVFSQEPLPPDDGFWHHPRITVTPHIAAITPPDSAGRRIARSYRQVMAGEPPLDVVDRNRGY